MNLSRQWLPRDKIEPLGLDSRLDEVKLIESKKPSMRKNVQEAYRRAISFRNRLKLGELSDSNDVEEQRKYDVEEQRKYDVEEQRKYENGFAECENYGQDVLSVRPNYLSEYLSLHSPIAVSLT